MKSKTILYVRNKTTKPIYFKINVLIKHENIALSLTVAHCYGASMVPSWC